MFSAVLGVCLLSHASILTYTGDRLPVDSQLRSLPQRRLICKEVEAELSLYQDASCEDMILQIVFALLFLLFDFDVLFCRVTFTLGVA